MSNSPFSRRPEDDSDADLDLTSDPPVDLELRDFIQRFSVGPTPEEQGQFWDDLSQKLPVQKAPAHLLAPVTFKRYLPWTALASGVAVVVLLLVPFGENNLQQVALSDRLERQETLASEALTDRDSDTASEPMVLGAPPAAREPAPQRIAKAKKAERDRAVDSQAPFGLAEPDFSVRWEFLSEKTVLVHVLVKDQGKLLQWAKNWPAGLVLTEVSAPSAPDAAQQLSEKTWIYRLEDRR